MARKPAHIVDRRDAQIAQLLEEGYSYEHCAKLAGIRVHSVKTQMKTKYPELYERLKSKAGRPRKQPTVSAAEFKRREALAEQRRQKRLEKARRRAEIAEHFFADPMRTLDETGEAFGVTRERVRQILAQDFPGRYAAKKSERRKLYEQKDLERNPPRYCVTCGAEIPRHSGRVRYCSAEHREIRLALRYHLDPNMRDRQKKAVAKWVLRAAEEGRDSVTDYMVEYAERVLDPEVETEGHGRWLAYGSKNMDYAVEAYRNNWPIFELLPEQIQEQVRRVAAGREEAEAEWPGM